MKRPSALLALALLSLAVPALAQQDAAKLADRLNKKAMEDYDALEFDSARQTLQSAIAKLRDAGQDETPTAARIYMNLGVVYIAGFKDRNRGIHEFVNALKIDANAQLDPERATPELQEAFEAAQKQVSPKRPPVRNVLDGVKGLQHNAVDEGRAGIEVPIKAQLGADVNASRLVLFYRGGGQEDYVSVPMKQAGPDWIGVIPGEAMEGKAVQYYLEARDARGRPVIAAGTAASPYIISVSEARGPNHTEVDAEDPLAGRRRKHTDEETPSGRSYGRLFVNLMGGVGVGVAPAGNVTEVAYLFQASTQQYVPQPIGTTGIVFQPLHLAAEVGVNLTRHIGLSAVARFGFTLINNADTSTNPPLGTGTKKAENDFAAMLRFRYQFGEKKVHPFVHLGAGGGVIRHVLDVSGAETDDHPLVDFTTADFYNNQVKHPPKPTDKINEVCLDHKSCLDSLASGYLLVAVGGGIELDLVNWKNGGFGLLLDGDAIFALPVGGQFGINIDLQLGIAIHAL